MLYMFPITVHMCMYIKMRKSEKWHSVLTKGLFMSSICQPFTEQSVAFHSRLWPSSWREPAREAHPGPEVQRRGSCFSYFPSLAWMCWRAQESRTLFIQKQWKTDHLCIFLYTLFLYLSFLYLTVFSKVALFWAFNIYQI